MKFLEKHPLIMIIIGVLGISVSAILVRFSEAPATVTAFYRLFFSVLFLTPMLFANPAYRNELAKCSRQNFLLSACSGIFLALHFSFWFESLFHTSVASSTEIVCTEVIWVAIGSALFLKERLSKTAVLSIVLTLFGSSMIALSDSASSGVSGNELYGDILSLLAAIFVTVYTLIGRKVRAKLSTTVYTYIVYFFCMLSLAAAMLARSTHFGNYGWNPVICGLLLGIFSTLLGHSIFSWCLKYFSPTFVSATKLCEPIAASIFAFFLFGEVPVMLQIIGGGITIGGVFLYSYVESRLEG